MVKRSVRPGASFGFHLNQEPNYDVSSVDAVPLTIIFGIPHVFGGLLPWQSTSTEILTWPSHSSLTESDFGSLLTRFLRISQRWGR
ncbi:ditrans,polycis-polyprenyl diphosphate synthase [Sparganum proliferum]